MRETPFFSPKEIIADAVVECGLLPICILKGGKIAAANERFTRLFSSDRNLVGAAFQDCAIPEQREHLTAVLAKALNDGTRERAHFQANRFGGGHFEVEVNAVRVGSQQEGTLVLSLLAVMDRRRPMAELRSFAFVDPVTGLSNRALFLDRLRKTLPQARRQGGTIGVMVADLDEFKTVNDTFGHVCGDSVLKTVGVRLTKTLRDSDTVARMGADEFAVMLPRLGQREDAALVAGRIIRNVAEPLHVGMEAVQVGISLGVATWPDNGDDIDSLYVAANKAMYAAKDAGTNLYRFAESEVDGALAAHLPVFDWNDNRHVGIKTMDEQHKQIVESMNNIGAALAARHEPEKLWSLFEQLASYTQMHFATEESLMDKYQLPSSARHKDNHRRLVDDLLSLSINFDNQSMVLAMRYFQDWFFRHNESDDRPMAAELVMRGER